MSAYRSQHGGASSPGSGQNRAGQGWRAGQRRYLADGEPTGGEPTKWRAPTRLLVIAGDPGIGKTTLWTEATRRAAIAGYRVLSSWPVPYDAGLPHVVLADLLRPVSDDALEPLPGPQRRALLVALLRAEPGEGDLDPRAVGTGLTELLGGWPLRVCYRWRWTTSRGCC